MKNVYLGLLGFILHKLKGHIYFLAHPYWVFVQKNGEMVVFVGREF